MLGQALPLGSAFFVAEFTLAFELGFRGQERFPPFLCIA